MLKYFIDILPSYVLLIIIKRNVFYILFKRNANMYKIAEYIVYGFFAILIIVLLIEFIYLIFLCAFPHFTDNFVRTLKEVILIEIQKCDKESVKNGTAVYMTCDTYMVLHESEPFEYPLYSDNPELLFEELKNCHSIVFRVKEANKLRKIFKKKEKDKIELEIREEEYKHQVELNEKMAKALKDVERMKTDIERFSKKKEIELNKTIIEQKDLIKNIKI